MTTTTPALAARPILALDLGKYKSVACLSPGDPATATFVSFPTDRDRPHKLFAQHRPDAGMLEAGLLAGCVHDLCHELGLAGHVANTASKAGKFNHTQRQTDKDDALRLAQLFALGQLPTATVPPPATRPWRALIARRQALVGRRGAVPNRIHALLVGQGLPAPRGAKAWTERGLQGIGPFARPLAACGPAALWRGRLELAPTELRQVRQLTDQAAARLDPWARQSGDVPWLETVPGVGPRTAAAIGAHLHAPGRFDRGKQVSAYVGLVPRQYPSGERGRRGRITRRGPALWRKLLVECAGVMLRYNPWARAVYQRLSRGPARQKQAIVALARKLLVRCWAMLRDQTPGRDRTSAAATPAGAEDGQRRGTTRPE
jgi:transposase